MEQPANFFASIPAPLDRVVGSHKNFWGFPIMNHAKLTQSSKDIHPNAVLAAILSKRPAEMHKLDRFETVCKPGGAHCSCPAGPCLTLQVETPHPPHRVSWRLCALGLDT